MKTDESIKHYLKRPVHILHMQHCSKIKVKFNVHFLAKSILTSMET